MSASSRERTLLEAIASSLTELFAPGIIAERISGMLQHYTFVDEEMLAYFRPRLDQAPRDADFALAYVKEHADTPEMRRTVCEALIFKCDVLCGRSSTRCTMPTCSAAASRRAPSCRARSQGRGGGMSRWRSTTTRPLVRPAWVRLKHCPVRERWVLLVPERVLFPCPTSVTLLERLAKPTRPRRRWSASWPQNTTRRADVIRADVVELLSGLVEKGYVRRVDA